MGKIQLIQGFEKIAAGEVIERPASVVKELLENSLDANAIHITIIIEQAGKTLIQVIDDGNGIDPEDVETAFLPHTSSKIKSADELDKIHTLGFRGEALPSIAAVSQIEIITRTSNCTTGKKYVLNEGKKVSLEDCGAPVGTNLQVRNLFFNLPVRRKFLRSDRIELGHITDIVSRYILAYPNVHFKLSHNGLVLLNTPEWIPSRGDTGKYVSTFPSDSIRLPLSAYGGAIAAVYGKKTVEQMIPIEFNDENIVLFGYLGKPELARSDRVASSLFVNRRLVINQGIAEILDNAYRDYLMRQKYPFYILFVEVPPAMVDFNIHPTKKIVKFINEDQFMNHLQIIISDLVKSNFLREIQASNQSELGQKSTVDTVIDYWTPSPHPQISAHISSKSDSISEITHISKSKQSHLKSNISSNVTKERQISEISSLNAPSPSNLGDFIDSVNIPTRQLPPLSFLNAVGQVGNTYLVFQNDTGIVIIDQHAADERINYERVQQYLAQDKVPIQKLLVPIKMEVSSNEVEFITAALPDLLSYGFEVEHFGGTTFLIRSIPALIKEPNQPLLIADMCHEILAMGKDKSLTLLKREIIQYIACHKSIRAGESIWNRARVRRLIQDLDACQNPHNCAHGRPTYIQISFNELEKLFHRKN